jgi:hypothetical protein
MRTLRVDYFHVWSCEGGSPQLFQLRTASVGPWGASIDYVLTHTRLWGPANLVTLTVVEFDDTTPYLTDAIGIVCGPPTDAHRGITWKTCTRVRWAWLDSLIVVVNCGHSWDLREPHVSFCHIISLTRLHMDLNLHDTLGYGWGLLTVFKHSNGTLLLLIWELWGWPWLLCSQGLIIINYLVVLLWHP